MVQIAERRQFGNAPLSQRGKVMSVDPLITFMIATRNRVKELERTLANCSMVRHVPTEILVVDDESSDGTYERICAEFPHVNIVKRVKNQGSIAARNDILRRARGKFIIGLDDDSRFIDPDDCGRVVERMEAEPDLGIIAFQAVGPENPERMTEEGRLHGEWHCSSFAACGVAIRREMLKKTGLLAEFFFHAYEEPDLCVRAWDAGYRVLQWNDIVVYHEFSSLNRNEQRTHRRHARNEACSTWMRAPWQLVLPITAARLASQSRYAASRGWLLREPRVWAEFLWRLPRCLMERQPVGARAIKICLAVNRAKVADPQLVWEFGNLSWRQILRGEFPVEIHTARAAALPSAHANQI
jgi:GT2 family glycosyltransferase